MALIKVLSNEPQGLTDVDSFLEVVFYVLVSIPLSLYILQLDSLHVLPKFDSWIYSNQLNESAHHVL